LKGEKNIKGEGRAGKRVHISLYYLDVLKNRREERGVNTSLLFLFSCRIEMKGNDNMYNK